MTITANTFLSVNIGTAPNDGTGDPLRTSFSKLNDNFTHFTDTIWPNIQITRLFADITSSFISSFNLLQADSIESSFIGNANTQYIGNTFSVNTFSISNFVSNVVSANILTGVLGNIGANAAFVTNLNATGTATVNNLTVNNSITVSSINVANIGNVTPGQIFVTNLSVTNDITLGSNTSVGNVRWLTRDIITTPATVGSNFTVNLARSSSSQYRLITLGNSTVTVSNITYGQISTGIERIIVFKNNTDSLSTRYITLPTTFNSSNVSNIRISPGGSAFLHFIPFDSTEANVYVLIANC